MDPHVFQPMGGRRHIRAAFSLPGSCTAAEHAAIDICSSLGKTHLRDQILAVHIDLGFLWKADVNLADPVVSPLWSVICEWSFSVEELVQQHAKSPCVHLVAVGSPLHQFRRQIVHGATHRHPLRLLVVDRPSKVAQLHFPVCIDQQVFQLQISMDDVLGLAEYQCAAYLYYVTVHRYPSSDITPLISSQLT